MKKIAILSSLIFTVLSVAAIGYGENAVTVNKDKSRSVLLDDMKMAGFDLPKLAGKFPDDVTVTDAGGGWQHVKMVWNLDKSVKQDVLSVEFSLDFEPDFWWSPHLSPNDGDCIAQHVFRSPAIIAAKGRKTFVMVPDIGLCGKEPNTPWFMDFDAEKKKIWLGLSKSEIWVPVGYRKAPGMVIPKGKVELAFYTTAYKDDSEVFNPWDRVTHFFWEKYARPLYAKGQPGTVPMDRYVEHTYNWAFDSWGDVVWQEFDLGGKRVGACQFIVNFSQSPNYKKPWFQREFLSIWNQAWFSSMRSASGVLRYARRTGNEKLTQKAKLTKAFALAAPMKDGIFPAVYRTDNYEFQAEGKKYQLPQSWDKGYWTNSNRGPYNLGVSTDWYHILDSSWTALLMLRWYEEFEQDPELIGYARKYADKLLTLQDKDGFYPGWLHPQTLEPTKIMFQTPETSMSVTFLLKLADITDQQKYRSSATKAMDAVLKEIVPDGRWEDFETYWSCNRFGQDDHVGKKYARNAMYKQNTFSIFWTAEALLAAYKTTGDKKYLNWGRRTLDELSMAQQVWQPPFIYIPAVGGFGVMNFDGEWNDSRQCLFAELFMDYYRITGDTHLFERGITALKSAFVMMYCPENSQVKLLWEKVYPFFGKEDYGFTMENYGHGGETDAKGIGIGTFTIYDWGNGAASEARNRIHDHYGDVYIDRQRKQGFGIDSVAVEITKDQIILTDLADVPRNIKIVFEDLSSKKVFLDGTKKLIYDLE